MSLPDSFKRAMERKPVYADPNPSVKRASTELKRDTGDAPLAAGEVQKEGPRRDSRIQVHVISFRRRLLDEDNLVSKYHNDGLRYCGLLPTDAPQFVSIRTTQEKVAMEEEERTEITLSYDNGSQPSN